MEIYGVTGDREVDGILTALEQAALEASQQEAYESVLAFWAMKGSKKPPLVIKPTGYGKGRVIDKLIHRIASFDRTSKTLLIVGTKDVLVEQNQESLRSLVHEETGEERFSILPDTSEQVILCTWQGLAAFLKKNELPDIGLVIVDEVHNIGTVRRLQLLGRISPRAVVGLTATAFRSSGEFRDPESYGFEVLSDIVSTLPECINHRWLSPLMGLGIDTHVVLPRSTLTQFGTLNSKALYKELKKHPELFKGIAQDIAKRFLPSGMKTIVVVNRVMEEAVVIAEELMAQGFKVGLAVNQRASRELSERFVTEGAIARYKLPHDHPDAIQVLISPQVIGEGFDAPATECVIWAGSTGSSLRYTQVMGRGARRCRGKRYCLVVDYCYLIEGYGYSMNFAQFFKRSEIKELDGGVLYVGPASQDEQPQLPAGYTENAQVISILDLRRERKRYPPQGDWLTVSAIARELGRGGEWVSQQLRRDYKHLDALAETRMATNRNARTCYPPSVLEALREPSDADFLARGVHPSQVKPAGDWYTTRMLGDELNRTQVWVYNLLMNHLGYKDSREIRKSDLGRRGVYYPPSSLVALRAVVAEEAALFGVEDPLLLEEHQSGEVAARTIALALSRPIEWVEAHIATMPAMVAQRKLRKGAYDRPDWFYPGELKRELRVISESEGK